ncbi:MAG: hypothetical protein QM642_11490 [Edaphocola sp.]
MNIYMLLLITLLSIIIGCKDKGKFISNFDNDVFLNTKAFLDSNSQRRDSNNIQIIGRLYDKKQKSYVNDTILFQTYWEYRDGNTDAFCGASNYHMKRRIRWFVHEDGKVDTLPIGILSANVEKSIPAFIHHIDSSLKATYFKTVKSSEQIPISLDIQLDYCRISQVVINADKQLDKNLIHELYRIVYISPKWQLDEVEATQEEHEKASYVRDKQLSIDLEIYNNEIRMVNYTVDSVK